MTKLVLNMKEDGEINETIFAERLNDFMMEKGYKVIKNNGNEKKDKKEKATKATKKNGLKGDIKLLKFIPYNGKIDENRCMAMKKNDGLYNQCVKPTKVGSSYCTVCQKQADKNDNGKPNDGDIRDEYTGIRVKLGDIIAKGKVSKEAILEFAELNDFEISDEEFELTRKARKTGPKRKQKDEAHQEKNIAEVSDTDEEKEDKVEEAHQEKKVEEENVEEKVEEENVEDDKIEEEKVEEKNVEEEKVEEKPKKKRGRPKKNEKNEENEEKPKKRGRPKKNEKTQEENVISVDKILNKNDKNEDEEETLCDLFKFQGKQYLKDTNNMIYDFKTEEIIGKFNPESNEIEFN